jgi:hypothetical protein
VRAPAVEAASRWVDRRRAKSEGGTIWHIACVFSQSCSSGQRRAGDCHSRASGAEEAFIRCGSLISRFRGNEISMSVARTTIGRRNPHPAALRASTFSPLRREKGRLAFSYCDLPPSLEPDGLAWGASSAAPSVWYAVNSVSARSVNTPSEPYVSSRDLTQRFLSGTYQKTL